MLEKIEKWVDLYEQLKILKDQEVNLRKEICEEIFNGERKTKKVNIGPYKVKAVYKINSRIDEAAYTNLEPMLSTQEKEAIRIKFDLVQSKMKKLDLDSLLMQCIIQKPGTPTLEVKDGN